MSSILSERQKEELYVHASLIGSAIARIASLTRLDRACRHKSILDYLQTNGYTETLNAFKEEADQPDFQPDPKAKWSGLLEKKWTSVIRLQKKVRLVRPLRHAHNPNPTGQRS